jgi:ADP-heptose:LPS heptosyltransferase/glycosyltransferase involved in cell wall biosynthesis
VTAPAMKILVVTNRFPPDGGGGYALGSRRVAEALESRGHEIRVLASAARPGGEAAGGRILRLLARDRDVSPSWQTALVKEIVNQSVFGAVCREFRPDAVMGFDLSGISISLAGLAARWEIPLVFYVSSDWLATWERDIWYRAWPKADAGFKVLRFLSRRFGLAPVSPPLESALIIFASRHLEAMARQTGKTWPRAAVVPWGIDTERFSPRGSSPQPSGRLLYVGRVAPEKRLDQAIRALGLIARRGGAAAGASLTIAGDERAAPGYTAYLRELAASCGVLERLTFAGYVPPSSLPDLYRAHGIFVYPSSIVEPLSAALLEAMACGLGVVATATGGNAEFLREGENSLIIPQEDGERLAERVLLLLQSPELLSSLGAGARATVLKDYELGATTSSLEERVREAAEAGAPARWQAPAAGKSPGPSAPSTETLDKVLAKARRWLGWGGLVVLARNVLRPKKVARLFKRAVRAVSAFVSLLLFPALLEPLFKLAGFRRAFAGGSRPGPRSVLVVQLADLGDVILSSPFLRELRRHLPRARIALVVQPALVNIVERCPYVDEIVPYDWRTVADWMTAFRGAPGWWRSSLRLASRRLWRRRFDLAVSLRRNNDPCQSAALILMYASGAARRVAYIDRPNDPKLRSPRFADRLITEGPFRGAPKHEVEYQGDILRFLGADAGNSRLETWIGPEDEEFARKVTAGTGGADDGPLVAVAPGARWSYRRWPTDRFTDIGAWLQHEFQARLLILAGASEKPLADRIAGGLDKDRTLNLAGRTTLRQMAAVLSLCRLFVGIDSGPMHLATAAGIPVVGLFGPGEYLRFRPWGKGHEVIRLGLTCNPCSESCLFDRALCVEGIGLDQVKRVLAGKLADVLK